MKRPSADRQGFSHILLLLFLVSVVGVIVYLFVTSTVPFRDGLFKFLYPKERLHAEDSTLSRLASAGLLANFGFGLDTGSDPDGVNGWMPASQIPWTYSYQFLASGWINWNDKGQFPLNYAKDASKYGFVPVFSYYTLLQSAGPCGNCPEGQKDLSHLNDTTTMGAYFKDFITLMKRLGTGNYDGIQGYGKPVIVQIEPDLEGFAMQAVNNGSCSGFCTGRGNDPSLLRAAVASTGVPEVSDYPDTYQGYNWALNHLRDLYAPNVLLGFHTGNWATGTDISSDTNPNLDIPAVGNKIGVFASLSGVGTAKAGTSTYDLIFSDAGDRDAAYAKYVLGRSNAFWDKTNTNLPNFKRWEQYVKAISSANGGKKVIVSLVPVGNQYFKTMNNTYGHYQDNKAEYLFGHVDELASSGIIGVIFGRGNDGSSVQFDFMKDGITNPAAICGSDGLSGGTVCNNHDSTVSDDDGGYLRMAGRSYYANPYKLTQPTASAPSPAASSPPSGEGNGLTGVYFDNNNFTGASLTRIDPVIDFDWGQGSPAPAIGSDTFSVRWTGQILAPDSGTYTIYAKTDDGVRVWVGNVLLIDNWHDQSAAEAVGKISLTAGQKYAIKVEYYDDYVDAVAVLSWSGPGFSKQVIPRKDLYAGAIVNTSSSGPTLAPSSTPPPSNTPTPTPTPLPPSSSCSQYNGKFWECINAPGGCEYSFCSNLCRTKGTPDTCKYY